MRAALFYYDGFAEFEVALALLYLRNLEWAHIAIENRPYMSFEGQTFLVSKTIDAIDANTIDLLVIPGGDSLSLFKSDDLKDFIMCCVSNGGVVAGICGGAELLAGLGLLEGLRCTGGANGIKEDDPLFQYFKQTRYVSASVVSDCYQKGLIITAQGESYKAFANKLVRIVNERKTSNKE